MSSVPSVEIACPKCTQRIAIPQAQWQQYVGKVTACPTCSQQILIQDFAAPPAPAVATVASDQPEPKKPERRSPRWTKMAMLIATAAWLVWMPVSYTYFNATAHSGYTKVKGTKNDYRNNATGKVENGLGLEIATTFKVSYLSFTIPAMLYFATIFVLAVMHFALTR